MADNESSVNAPMERGPEEDFNAEETVRSWIRLATQSRGKKKKNYVRLNLAVTLDTLIEASDREKELLVYSLVNLVKAAYVDATLVLTCVEPGSGLHGGNSAPPPVGIPPPIPGAPEPETSPEVIPTKTPERPES